MSDNQPKAIGYKIAIYLKSGNVIRLRAKEFTIKTINGQVTEWAYVGMAPGHNHPININPDQIEAVVQVCPIYAEEGAVDAHAG